MGLHFGAGPLGQRDNLGFAVWVCSRTWLSRGGDSSGDSAGDNGRKPEPRAAPCRRPPPRPRHRCVPATAPPVLFPSHCPQERKDVSSLLPFCLKGMWGGRGEAFFLPGPCAISTIAAFPSAVPLRPGQGADASWPEPSPGSPLLCTVLAAEMRLVPRPRWQPAGSDVSSRARSSIEITLQRGF